MMRKLISMLILCSLFLIPTACKKRTTTIIAKTAAQQLKDLDAVTKKGGAIIHYPTNSYAAKPPNPYGTMLSDGFGALGGAVLGPLGAFCGGVTASINYAFGFGWDRQIANPTPISVNPQNPFDIYGSMHNNTCSYILSVDNLLTPTAVILLHAQQYGLNNYKFTGPIDSTSINNLLNIIMNNSTASNIETSLTDMLNAGYITLQEYNVTEVYFNTLITSTDPIAYSIAAEAIINSSSDLSASSKMKILISMAVTRNSFVFWQAQ